MKTNNLPQYTTPLIGREVEIVTSSSMTPKQPEFAQCLAQRPFLRILPEHEKNSLVLWQHLPW
jgi:hypothetical protein